ncbi:MAG: hypothetical protein ABIH37_04640 [archaeon]
MKVKNNAVELTDIIINKVSLTKAREFSRAMFKIYQYKFYNNLGGIE